MSAVEQLLYEWAVWQRAAGMSRRTIEGRQQLLTRLALVTDPVTCNWQPIAAFLADSAFSYGTRQTYHNDLRQWFKWLMIMDHRPDDPMTKLHKPRQPRRTPRPITTDELNRLLDSGIYGRTRTMVVLAAYAGLRVHEIAKFRGEHIRGDVLRVVGKGGLDSLLPLHPRIAAEAACYPKVGYWFPSPDDRSGPILPKSVSNLLSKAMRRAGVHGSAHQLRHWYGTHALKAAGGNLRVAQELLRHANIATTAGYTQVDETERRAALLALPSTSVRDAIDPYAGLDPEARKARISEIRRAAGRKGGLAKAARKSATA